MRQFTLSKNVKQFLSLIGNRQFFTFLFFLLVSAAFWLFTALNESTERSFQIPLHILNLPENIVLTSDPPSSLRLTLRDRGVVLLRYAYFEPFDTITLDWNELPINKNSIVLNATELCKPQIASLQSSTKVVSISPEVSEVNFNYGQSKRLPVIVQGKFETDSAYSLVAKDSYPRTVLAYASPEVLDTLSAARIEVQHLRNLSDTTSRYVRLIAIPGVKFVPDVVQLRIYADRLVEKSIEIPVQGVNFPADKLLRTFPAKVKITFQIGARHYKNITADNFVLVVNYEDIINDTDGNYRLSLKSVPNGVKRARLNPSSVEYLIEQVSPDIQR